MEQMGPYTQGRGPVLLEAGVGKDVSGVCFLWFLQHTCLCLAIWTTALTITMMWFSLMNITVRDNIDSLYREIIISVPRLFTHWFLVVKLIFHWVNSSLINYVHLIGHTGKKASISHNKDIEIKGQLIKMIVSRGISFFRFYGGLHMELNFSVDYG